MPQPFKEWELLDSYGKNHYMIQSLGRSQYRMREVTERWGKRHNRKSDGEEIIIYDYSVLAHDNSWVWHHENRDIIGVLHLDVDNWRIVRPSQAMHMTKAQILEHLVREHYNDWMA